MKQNVFKKNAWILTTILLVAVVYYASAGSTDFLGQRRKFREEIKNKIETRLDAEGNYLAVTFKGEENKYNFQMTSGDGIRLKIFLTSYFSCREEVLLSKMLEGLNKGQYIVHKEFHKDGVNLKTVFLSPKVKYWEWLTDYNGIEKMFHVYNFSVGLYKPDPDSMSVILQTEGSFFGVTQAVSLPIVFNRDNQTHKVLCRMPTQEEILSQVKKMPAIKQGRNSPEQKFTDACRTHPFFQQTDSMGKLTVTDDYILKLYKTVIANKDAECPVKDISGGWHIQEDYPYMVVDYSLKTAINIEALIPKSMRVISGTLDSVVQQISDEVSIKYLPLSMKNFRDFTQEWTRKGRPD